MAGLASGRTLGVGVSLLLVGLVVAVLASRFLRLEDTAEGEILTQLKATEREGLSVSVPGAAVPLVSAHHHFDRISVSVDPQQGTAYAVATLDFTGKLGSTEVSSLGLEKIPFRYRDGAWVPTGSLAPVLSLIVGKLEARREALARGDVKRLISLWGGRPASPVEGDVGLQRLLSLKDRDYRVKAWYLRSEREQITVTEAYRLAGQLPDRPVDEEGVRSLILTNRGQELSFWPGLM